MKPAPTAPPVYTAIDPTMFHLLHKVKQILLVAYYHFGHRLSPHFLERPVHELYYFLRTSASFPAYVGRTDLSFLEVFALGNQYHALLPCDNFGVVDRIEAINFGSVPGAPGPPGFAGFRFPGIPVGQHGGSITVMEAMETAAQCVEKGYPLIMEVLKALLRVQSMEGYQVAPEVELVWAAGCAYS
ncbi:Protein of unknown function [Pyronema omphalodes CBS 100304]|uniref:Uncharacterized protein n=1 Tax=Pyronema omphalodes (strain CBS 100304) TaxID=1076935 RepID=U4KZS7_PYROM|nr:Protein of unknown function [Pyronema omphalodes CBS 100304]